MLWRLFLCINLLAFGATDPLILPRPIQSNFSDERFTPTQPGTLTISGATPEQLALARRVLLADGTLQHIEPAAQGQLEFGPAWSGEFGYALDITSQKISVGFSSNEQLHYALTTLRQLAWSHSSSWQVPIGKLYDAPCYPHRGYMLDESRHFTGKTGVKRLLDAMELLKLNVFHWHLTDGSGWRIEIKKYPKLTTIGATGNHTDPTAAPAYYAQEDIREIVAYATERGIIVIPEIDMPGHASAANRSYPEFSGGGSAKYPDFTFNPASPATETYLHDILTEVRQLFPHAPMLHLGGDEVHFGWEQWPKLPEVKQLMQEKSFSKLDEVEGYFVRRIADHLHHDWDKIGLWDEASRFDLPPEKTVLFWWRHDKPQGLKDAVNKGYAIVLCPRIPLYFDFVQDASHQSGRRWAGKFAEMAAVYAFPESLGATLPPNAKILGLQANLWTETTVTQERRDFMTFPRLLAVAEAAWTKPEYKNFSHFQQSVTGFLPHLEALGIKPWEGGTEIKK